MFLCHFNVIRCIEPEIQFFSLEVPPEVSLSGPYGPVTEGDNVILTCNISDAVPKPGLIHWFREKISLDKNNRNMVLRSIKKEQEGTYTCETSNAGGSAKDNIKVIVDGKTLQSSVECYVFDMNKT